MRRSGTSIGVNVKVDIVAQSRKELISKMKIALNEEHEAEYWLSLFIYGK